MPRRKRTATATPAIPFSLAELDRLERDATEQRTGATPRLALRLFAEIRDHRQSTTPPAGALSYAEIGVLTLEATSLGLGLAASHTIRAIDEIRAYHQADQVDTLAAA